MQIKSELLSTAVSFGEAGIEIFAVEVNGKRPLPGSNGFYDATSDVEKIRALWSEADYNIAASPASMGCVVVDLDPGADESPWPPTYTVKTPRGKHKYYEGTAPSSAGKIAPHTDIRCQGGYVLLPGSVIDGKKYEVIDDRDYAPFPEWAVNALKVKPTELKSAVEKLDLGVNIDRARKVLQNYVKKGDVAKEGLGGDDRTYRLCCEMLDFGLTPHAAQELVMQEWNEACEPPWTAEEMEQKFYNASQFMQNEAGAYAVEPAADVFGAAVRKLDLPAEKPSRFYFKDEDEQDASPDAKWLVPQMVVERSTMLFYGARSSYKSLLVTDMMLGVAAGQETFGVMPQSTGPVFYGAREGQGGIRKHRRAWRIAKQINGKVDFFLGLAPIITDSGEIQQFGDEIKKRCDLLGKSPAMIALDTLARCMTGLDENSVKDTGMFIEFCDSLVFEFKCPVIAVHHSGHERGRARGSSALEAGFDTVAEVIRHKDTNCGEVRMHKQKEMEERNAWTFETQLLQPSLIVVPTTLEQHRILTGDAKVVDTKTAGAALKKIGALDSDSAVATRVLAEEIAPVRENDSHDEREGKIEATVKALKAAAKSGERLEAYVSKRGKELWWHLSP